MWSFLKQLNNRDRAVHREEFSRHFEGSLRLRPAWRSIFDATRRSIFVRQNLKQLRTYNLQAVFNLCLAQFRRTLQGVLV